VLFGATLLQVLAAVRAAQGGSSPESGLEIRVSLGSAPGLFQLTGQIAAERKLRTPDEIRISADSVAHVYEDDHGREVLVIGAMVIAAFTREALAGVIAHELAHFAAGDTRRSRRGFKRLVVMAYLDDYFASRWATNINPIVWLIRAYHLGYRLLWAWQSRQQEFAADRQDVTVAGKEVAAAALIHITVMERLPWVRLSSVAQSYVASNMPIEQLFAEQAARARSVESFEWEDALGKELKKKQGRFDSHPCLRDRLKAIDISPKKALKLALRASGPPATALFADWRILERELTVRLVHLVQQIQAAKMEMAQIFAGRPLSR
jgi:Zn-dependent protease with chaperone function